MIVLVSSSTVIMPVYAANIATAASVGVLTNPPTRNYPVQINCQIFPTPPNGTTYHALTIKVTNPYGSYVILGPFQTSGIGGLLVSYTPTDFGTYEVLLNYPGEIIDNNTYLASSGTTTFDVGYSLLAWAIPSAGGSVSKNPDQISYDANSSVTLTAIPSDGYVFDHWSGDLSGTTNPNTIIMTGNKWVNATFNPINYTLSLTVSISPSSVTCDLGQSRFFNSIVSGGISPYSYQWYLDGSPVSGATNFWYSYPASSLGSHNVFLAVTDSVNATATSNTASVTVNPALMASVSPNSWTMDVGQSKLFSSIVSGGTAPFSYRWYLNGLAVSGATDPTWTFSPSSAGTYNIYVYVMDAANASWGSGSVTVTVNDALSAGITPSGPLTLNDGQVQVFNLVVLGGTPSFSYQWYLDNNPVSGETGISYSYTATILGSPHSVKCVVTDSASTPTSKVTYNIVVVTVNAALGVSVAPSSVTMDVGQSQTFTSSLTPTGSLPYYYTWYLDGSIVSSVTKWDSSDTTWWYAPSSAGSHSVYLNVGDGVGHSATSNNVFVTVNAELDVSIGLYYPLNPMDVGQSQLFFSSVNFGTPPYSYHWYFDGSPGSTNSNWTYTPSSAGSHTVYVLVRDAVGGERPSNNLYITVNDYPGVSISRESFLFTLIVGQSQLFTANPYDGTPPYSYQWYWDAGAVYGATSATWTVTPSAGYHVVQVIATDAVGQWNWSNAVFVTVNNALGVSISPSSATMDVTQSKVFTSSVSGGTAPYSYQWYLDGALVSGATGTGWQYTPSYVGTHNAYVIVTDGDGVSATSNSATIIVNDELSVDISPYSVTLGVGQSQLFTCTVSGGTSPYSYKWYLDSGVVSTADTWTYTPSSAGSHNVYLEVTDGISASSISNIVVVTVFYVIDITILPSSVGCSVIKDPNADFFNLGQHVLLTAVPAPGYRFDHWAGDAGTSTNSLIELVIDTDPHVEAYFTHFEYTVRSHRISGIEWIRIQKSYPSNLPHR